MLRVNANAPQETGPNIADVTPGVEPPGSPPPPPVADVPGSAPPLASAVPAKRARADVKVLASA